MDEGVEKKFIREMREALQRQLSEFELAKKKEQHDAKIVVDEGAKRWRELKISLTRCVEGVNEGLTEGLLSYSENTSGNEFSLTHELNGRTMQITFDLASAVISYQGTNGKGQFRPRVEGDALEYGWENTTPCHAARRFRAIRFEEDERPMTFSTERMSEIIIRCIVLEPVADD